MAVSLKHAFTSAVPDGGDTSLVQPSNWNAEHTLTAGANTILGAVTAGAVGEITCTAAGRALIDDADAAAQRTTLGLGTIATQAASSVSITGGSITGITDLAVADGGTGASTAANARTNLAAAGIADANTFTANQIISVTDNTNAALRITQLGTGEAIRVEDSTNPDSTPFVVDASGNVGIGTASPDVKLQVANTSSAASPTWAGGTDFLKLFAGSGSAYSEQALAFQETGTNVGAKIGVKNTANGAYNIIFANRDTSSTTSTMTERFRIGTSGQLGIGGDNYGTSGQTIISGGSAAAPSWGTLGVAGGGTGATTANAGLTNLTTLTSTATAAGTTTLTNTSTYFQLFTGTTTQTVVLPVTSTLATGWTFHIVNNSTGNLTVNSSGGNLVVTVLPGTTAMCTCIGTTLTTAADWEAGLTDFSTATGTGSVVLANDPVFSTGIRIGTGGTLAAGSIYSNANWGMLFQAKQASPALGDYALLNSAGTIRMAINASGALGVGSTPSYGTAGQALTSNGTGSAPTWGTLGVAGGGTGVTSATAYALLAGGTTSTGAFQSLGTGTAGQVLTSNGASALPTWAAGPATPTLTSYTSGSGNWTIPSSGTFALVRAWGGGGSGGRGGATATNAGGGGGGGFSERLYRISDLGIAGGTVAYSVGAGGTAVSAAGAGNPGGNSTFSSGATLLTAYGGGPGLGNVSTAGSNFGGGGGGALGAGANNSAGELGGGSSAQGPSTVWGGGGGATAGASTGGNAYLGGGGGGGASGATLRNAGTSALAGAGGAASNNGTAATNGTAPAGGGGGQSANAGASGAGGAGRIEIWVW